ncbi:MAG: cytochrome C oxidase subunit IV family protein, partial [Steroidobacterales bacterium]
MIGHPVSPARTYVLVWVTLIALLLLTLGSAYLKLGWLNGATNLVIAVAKALLVMIFFMHLRSGHYVLRIVAAAGFFWLMLLIGP